MNKVVVVGAGFSGAILARKIAEELNFPVLVVEKRPHVGGNMYDEYDEHGILIHKYGPHVLVTNEWKIIKYLSRFTEFYKHTVKELSFMDGEYVRLPFNFESIQQMIGPEKAEAVINKLRKFYPGRDRVPMLELLETPDDDISSFCHLLFEKAYKTYCAKQWGAPIDTLDISIMNRVPLTLSYDERYMNKDFQYLPLNGYTEMFKTMLDHPNITLNLGVDATEHIKLNAETNKATYDGEPIDILVYTGAVDELFGLCYGELPYRSLDIKYEWYDKEQVFPEKIISYPQASGYTRKTEYKFMMNDYSSIKGTTIATEYPSAYVRGKSIAPFYPEITAETKERYQKYLSEAKKYESIFLCGRLAEFRYYNMDDCILRAFDVFEEIKENYNNIGENRHVNKQYR